MICLSKAWLRALVIVLVSGNSLAIAEECTYDQANQLQVFALAIELAREHWDKPDAAALRNGLTRKRYQREAAEGRVFYNIAHEFYSEFYVAHEFSHGMDRVTIFWNRNF